MSALQSAMERLRSIKSQRDMSVADEWMERIHTKVENAKRKGRREIIVSRICGVKGGNRLTRWTKLYLVSCGGKVQAGPDTFHVIRQRLMLSGYILEEVKRGEAIRVKW